MAEQAVRIAPMRALDSNGDPVSGALAYFYVTGTTTLEAVYSDSGLTTAHAQPLVADSAGEFAEVYHANDHGLKVVMTTSGGGSLSTVDPIPMTSSADAAGNISFSPVTGNAATDVQTAIANNTALVLASDDNLENRSTVVTTAGSGNAYTVSASETLTAYAAGQSLLVQFNRANTGAATLNVDSLGAKNLMVYNASGSLIALTADDILANHLSRVMYDGTQFVLLDRQATNSIRGLVEKSTTAENQAGTEQNKFPSVAGVKTMIDQFRPMQMVALGNLDGTGTPAFNYQTGFNASVTDNGTGDYSVAFDSAEADAQYYVKVDVESPGSGTANRVEAHAHSRSTTGFDIRTVDATGTATDYDNIHIMVVRA